MNIFVAGIHGVGKTYLASRAAPMVGMVHTSASKLIKEERALHTWSNDKRVSDVKENQIALAAAVRRHNELGKNLVLDGHFVLLGSNREMIPLEDDVFGSLPLRGVILIETDSTIIAQRIEERDQRKESIEHLNAFMKVERDQALRVCSSLNIPLTILTSPSPDAFTTSISSLLQIS